MAKVYKIHPSIGIARLGNSDRFYLEPDQAGALPSDSSTGLPVKSFRDAQGRLLKQAARFRVFVYESDGVPGTEVQVGSGGVRGIRWTVHLANKKACWFEFKQLTGSGMEGDKGYLENGPGINPLRKSAIIDRQRLILDPGPRTVGPSPLPSTQDFNLPASSPTLESSLIKPHTITTLGSLRLDSAGNLLVLGGSGRSGTTNLAPAGSQYEYITLTYANNEGWFDDTSDGPVTATLVMDDGSSVPVDFPAWCICAPPRYAPQILNMVTLRDTMFDIAVRELGARPDLYSNGQFNASYQVDYDNEVAPILSRPNVYRWVVSLPPQAITGHTGITQDQSDPSQFPFNLVRSPQQINVGRPLMPHLAGDNPLTNDISSKYLSLTATQYFLLQQWVNGKSGGTAPALGPGAALDQAVLENCVGGPFCPGIEMTWISRNATIYSEPFRIRHAVVQGPLSTTWGDKNDYSQGMQPGDVTKYMAQPWQADFYQCSDQTIQGEKYWWWPAQRPFDVFPILQPLNQVPWARGIADDPHTATPSNPNLGDMQMVEDWKHLGFVVEIQAGPVRRFLEIERQTSEIEAYVPPLIQPAADPDRKSE